MTVSTRPRRKSRASATESRGWGGAAGRLWALGQLTLLCAELFALLLLLAQPEFKVRDFQISGTQHLTETDVAAALSLPAERSIFLVNRSQLEARLQALPWVRTARVTLALPDRLRVKLVEWVPAAVLIKGEQAYFLSERGAVLGLADEPGSLPVIERADIKTVGPGQPVIDAQLLQSLITLQARFPAAFHLRVVAFSFDQLGVLSLRTDRGWPIIFGQMATSEERASLEPKLGALQALSAHLDFSGRIGYINLMNPRAPAVESR